MAVLSLIDRQAAVDRSRLTAPVHVVTPAQSLKDQQHWIADCIGCPRAVPLIVNFEDGKRDDGGVAELVGEADRYLAIKTRRVEHQHMFRYYSPAVGFWRGPLGARGHGGSLEMRWPGTLLGGKERPGPADDISRS